MAKERDKLSLSLSSIKPSDLKLLHSWLGCKSSQDDSIKYAWPIIIIIAVAVIATNSSTISSLSSF